MHENLSNLSRKYIFLIFFNRITVNEEISEKFAICITFEYNNGF